VAPEVEATAKVLVARQMGESRGCGGDRRQHGEGQRVRETEH